MNECEHCFEFTVEGNPVGKSRPRWGNGHMYTPKLTSQYEQLIKSYFYEKYGMAQKPLVAPVGVRLKIVYPIPVSTSKANSRKMLSGVTAAVCKPDLDNVIKIVLDALNGIAYKDDSDIIAVSATKEYGKVPRVEIQIQEI